MLQIVLPTKILDQLFELNGAAEICNEYGDVVGYYEPHRDVFKGESRVPYLSAKELRRLESEPGEFTLDEIFAKLESGTHSSQTGKAKRRKGK